MGKRVLVLLMISALLLPALCVPALASPDIKAPSAILMERSTGTSLYENNAHEKLHPASVTKIMTLLLVMEALENGQISWDDTVTASQAAASKGGSQVFLEEGETMSMEEMLKSVVVASANDCATALAEHLCGSESAFVDKMNARAKELGMANTHFVNCTGLDDDPEAQQHLTTAYDIASMSRELLGHEAIKKYTTIWMDTVRNGEFGLTNTNKLVRFYPGATGLKTGFTSSAGYCLSASAEKDGMELIAVVMHCDTSLNRFESAKALLNYGFANYCLYTPQLETPLNDVKVSMGTKNVIKPELSQSTPVLLDKSLKNSVKVTVEQATELTAPVERGQKLGKITVEAEGHTLAEIPVLAGETIPRLSLWQVTAQILRTICMG